jgi:hypothetical protein
MQAPPTVSEIPGNWTCGDFFVSAIRRFATQRQEYASGQFDSHRLPPGSLSTCGMRQSTLFSVPKLPLFLLNSSHPPFFTTLIFTTLHRIRTARRITLLADSVAETDSNTALLDLSDA